MYVIVLQGVCHCIERGGGEAAQTDDRQPAQDSQGHRDRSRQDRYTIEYISINLNCYNAQ